jgi:hypothetical protein
MIRNTTRSVLFLGLFASAPWLLGADGGGCTKTTPPSTPDAGETCVVHEGDRCGGNIRNACTCASGLVCGAAPGSSLPAGDVGGTCQKPSAAGSGGAHAAGSGGSHSEAGKGPTPAGHDGQLDGGAGMCVSKRGEHCGGNIKDPCTCAAGLQCKATQGSNLPPGDVGGTCEPPSDDVDAGSCVSDEGGMCGGNTNRPCSCATGLTCKARPGSTLPFGDVGGTCQPSAAEHACSSNADCSLKADYCTGCDCVALAPGESIKPCSGPGVRCLADPCMAKTAQCVNGTCEVR